MKRRVLIVALSALLTGFTSVGCQRNERGVEAKADRADVLNTAERDFIRKASMADMQEVEMGQLAQQKASNSDVKDYAAMIVKDHQNAWEELNSILDKNNVARPADQDKERASMDRTHMDHLNSLSGAEFDRSFLEMMVQSHTKALDTYRSELTSVTNADLKDNVEDFIPTIEKHLNRAQQLQSQLASTGESGKPTPRTR